MSGKWTAQDIPDLTGKLAVITGANSGLGLESAKVLAEKGAHVVMAVRNLDKGAAARSQILALTPDASIEVMKLDNADLSSVSAFAAAFKDKYDRLDILANNAGVMAIPRQETVDGFEMQFGVNHLAHFALTGLLLDIITRTPNSRVHNVSSSAQNMGSIRLDDLMMEEEYDRWRAYGRSKLANVLFTFELQKRLNEAGFDTISNVSHPGIVMTNLQANSVALSGSKMESRLYKLVAPFITQSVEMGILPMLYGMTAEDAKGGVYYGPRRLNMRGYPKEQKANRKAYDADLRARFWEVSEELTGVAYVFERD